MKKALLVLGLLVMAGCSAEDWERGWDPDGLTVAERIMVEAKERNRIEDRKTSLKDGRVYIGMTQRELARLWERPHDSWIDRSTSRYGIAEWWSFDYSCEPTRFAGYYNFHFENGILTYWSEN